MNCYPIIGEVVGRTELAVFEARLDIRVRRFDEPVERGFMGDTPRPQFDMAHELAGALQQAGWIRQRSALKEADVDVRGENVYVAERDIA